VAPEPPPERPPGAPESSWRRETLARLALGGGLLFVGGWAYLAFRLVRSGPRAAARVLRTGLRPGAIGRAIRTFPRALLLRGDHDALVALDRRCTHLGCRVRTTAGEAPIVCPCHGSRFDREGTPLRGPATRPLRRLRTSLDSRGGVVVHVED
jgi:Rieske Fe-S protein